MLNRHWYVSRKKNIEFNCCVNLNVLCKYNSAKLSQKESINIEKDKLMLESKGKIFMRVLKTQLRSRVELVDIIQYLLKYRTLLA